jgi:Domain of unknown function (DUF397)
MNNYDSDLTGATWHTATYSNGNGGNCVEVPARCARPLKCR